MPARLRPRLARVAWLAAGLLAVLPGGAKAAPTLPAGFEAVPLAEGLELPTAVAFAPDGRMFVAEKRGLVKVVTPDGALQDQPVLDLRDRVNAYADRGLIGLALDADFAANRLLYVAYTYDAEPSRPLGPKAGRLSRFVVGADGRAGDETVLLGTDPGPVCPPEERRDCLPAEDPTHTVGALRADPDGTLWLANGDGLSSGHHFGDARIRRPWDERSLSGKLLHVDRDGRGLPGHAFCPGETDLDEPCTKVFASGLRNPYRFQPLGDGRVFAGDVGWNSFEEIDVLRAGRDYGWPCWEGGIPTPNYSDLPECAQRRAEGAVVEPPAFTFAHGSGSATIVAGPRYAPAAGDAGYPAAYLGDHFVADGPNGWIRRLRLWPDGRPRAELPFAQGFAAFPVDLVSAPGGDLVVVTIGDGTVNRIRYAPLDRTPVARAAADRRDGALPLDVRFSGAGSGDPLGEDVAYAWDLGDGTTSTERDPVHRYTERGPFVARLRVTDAGGTTATAAVKVWPGETPPDVRILAPSGEPFRLGAEVALHGEATDDTDQALTGTSLRWDVELDHADHAHPLAQFPGERTSFPTVRSHDADSSYDITLTATAPSGLSSVASARISPFTRALTLTSEPRGVPVSYDGATGTTPMRRPAAVGFRAGVSVPERVEIAGQPYAFAAWSDGGPRVRVLEVPDADTTLVARYVPVAPDPAAGEGTVLPGPAPGSPRAAASRRAATPAGPRVRLSRGAGRSGVLAGIAEDPDGVARVEVALRGTAGASRARGVTARCRFVHASGRVSRARPCTRPVWVRARLAGRTGETRRRWRADLGRRPSTGRWSVLVRARDGRGAERRATLPLAPRR